jgi:hypothetical protein
VEPVILKPGVVLETKSKNVNECIEPKNNNGVPMTRSASRCLRKKCPLHTVTRIGHIITTVTVECYSTFDYM